MRVNPGQIFLQKYILLTMKHFKIFPAAAGIIALTATVGFVRDTRESEDAEFLRVKIGSIELPREVCHISRKTLATATDNETGHAYLVEIDHGNKSRAVTIDAFTGKILMSRDIPVKDA